MNAALEPILGNRLILAAETAADLMTPNPVSIRKEATVAEAIELLTHKGCNAAPVIDAAGRPVGVLSRTDILVHDREQGETPCLSRVHEIMTPAVFSVAPHSPVSMVIEEMLSLNVHQVYVVDGDGILVGVISALDILRRLQPWPVP